MPNDNLIRIPDFMCGIADDVLRDVRLRGKYRNVIPPIPLFVAQRKKA